MDIPTFTLNDRDQWTAAFETHGLVRLRDVFSARDLDDIDPKEGGARVVLVAGVRGEGGILQAKRSGLAAGFLVSRTGHLTRSDPPETGS